MRRNPFAAALVAVLVALLRGGHDWARHSLGVTFALLGAAMVALLVAGPPAPIAVLGAAWVVGDLLLLVLMLRPGTGALVGPRRARP